MCVFVTFLYGIMSEIGFLNVSIHDHCILPNCKYDQEISKSLTVDQPTALRGNRPEVVESITVSKATFTRNLLCV